MATFFFDNDISFRIVAALNELVHTDELMALRDRFPVDAPDTVWIPEAGKNGWVVISRDHNQRRRDTEHKALRQHGVRALYIRHGGQQETLFADAARIIKNWPKISAWGAACKPGELARLTTKDEIEKLKG